MIKNNRLILSAVAFSMAGFCTTSSAQEFSVGVLWALLIRQGTLLR